MAGSNNPALNGILIIDKPIGMSSMQAVARVRHRARRAKTGHAGTLDPLATGVLVLAIGRATKIINRFMDTDKRYETQIDLSAFTSTDDREGERDEVAVDQPPTRQAIEAAVERFVGTIDQRPPAFSAVKVGGQRAYKLARQGKPVQILSRRVVVHAIKIVDYDWPILSLSIHCDKGFYVRALARDLGEAMNTGGHCRSIRRTAVGPFTLEEAMSLDRVPDPLQQADLIAPAEALARLK